MEELYKNNIFLFLIDSEDYGIFNNIIMILNLITSNNKTKLKET